MKRIGLFLLAVVLVAGMTGCSSDDHDVNPIGTWNANIDWGCTGGFYKDVMHFYSDGTVVAVEIPASGNWSLDGKNITLNWSNGNIWVGTVKNFAMITGTTLSYDLLTGCWSATKVSDTP